MFTGLVEMLGRVVWLLRKEGGYELQIEAGEIAAEAQRGESVAVNGCCLTITQIRGKRLSFDLLQETLDRTNLHCLRPEMTVNLERAVRADSRMGGHFVQGHIDTTAQILEYSEHRADHKLVVALPKEFRQFVAFKGSIAINGISLTVAELLPDAFVCWIIPHTAGVTTLHNAKPDDLVNLEFDILAKYVERITAVRAENSAG